LAVDLESLATIVVEIRKPRPEFKEFMPTTSSSSAVLGASGCLLMIIVAVSNPQVQGKNPGMVSMYETRCAVWNFPGHLIHIGTCII
jgi:hypothetical protein